MVWVWEVWEVVATEAMDQEEWAVIMAMAAEVAAGMVALVQVEARALEQVELLGSNRQPI